MKILPEMYVWTRMTSLNFENHPDLEIRNFLTEFLPLGYREKVCQQPHVKTTD